MSEPQHPHPEDTGTNAGHPAPAAARAVVQPAVQSAGPTGLDSLTAVGARLAQLRESKNWSIDDVSARLKVSSAKLRALEAGDISHLPDTTFALGVVRSYAKMLGADPAPFTQALRREKGVPAPDLSMPASSGRDLPRGRVSLSLGGSGQKHRSWLWGIAAVIVAVIALAMWHTNGDSSAWLARLRASANQAAAGTSGASGTVAQGQTAGSEATAEAAAPAASATDEGQSAADNAASATPMPTPLPTATVAPSAAPLAAAPKAGSQAAAQAVSKAASAPLVATAASQAAATAAGESIVAIRVTQDSWFSVRQSDGKVLFSGLVQAGDSKEISGVGPFKVTVGNTAGLESMTLDGQPVDRSKYASAKGNVARLTLP